MTSTSPNKKRGGRRKTRIEIIGNPLDAASLYHQMLPFLDWMRVRNYSEQTVLHREQHLRDFIHWCDERGLAHPGEITRPILERYQKYLFLYRKSNGEALSGRSQHMRLVPLRLWFRWLVRQHRILTNPASDLDMPRIEKRLPKHILSADEADKVLNGADVGTPLGCRDRAIMETFYSTGIRRTELCNLHSHDIDYDRGTLMVRQGKGKKDRLLPIGERALAWIAKYRDSVRPQFALAADDGTLFLLHQGDAMDPKWLSQMVRQYINKANIGKTGSCHLFRHTMATLMLENGADLRFIQIMLGHAALNTTELYTQLAINKLKEIHTLTHPARLTRTESTKSSESTLNDIAGATEVAPLTVEALLATLEAEAAEEEKS